MLRPGGIVSHTRTRRLQPADMHGPLLRHHPSPRVAPKINYSNSAPVDWVSRVADRCSQPAERLGARTPPPHRAARTRSPGMVRDQELGGLNVRVMPWDVWLRLPAERCETDPVPELEFMARVLREPRRPEDRRGERLSPDSDRGADRAVAFVARHETATTRPLRRAGTAETPRRAGPGRAGDHLSRGGPPHLWFRETMRGKWARSTPGLGCSAAPTALTLSRSPACTNSVAALGPSMYARHDLLSRAARGPR
ncbi:hypothetical protein LV779_15010 [Streptomyces thinghirensis]|nr:hypothetical protein [Streptomyces thinghirensis]